MIPIILEKGVILHPIEMHCIRQSKLLNSCQVEMSSIIDSWINHALSTVSTIQNCIHNDYTYLLRCPHIFVVLVEFIDVMSKSMSPWGCGAKSALLHNFGQKLHCSIKMSGKEQSLHEACFFLPSKTMDQCNRYPQNYEAMQTLPPRNPGDIDAWATITTKNI